MTVVLVALGSSLFAVAMVSMTKATEPLANNLWWYGVFASIVSAFIAYGIALRREWRREKAQEKRDKEREKRDKQRFEEEKKLWETVQLIVPEKKDDDKP